MPYDPKIHHRKSIRLKDYDYSESGAYFITICVKDSKNIFGKIENYEMILSELGYILAERWVCLPDKFNDIRLGVFAVMPNHFHGILIIEKPVGAPLAGALNQTANNNKEADKNKEQDFETAFDENKVDNNEVDCLQGAPARGAPTMGEMVGIFKSLCMKDWVDFKKQNNIIENPGTFWQRNFYDHIIRTEKSYIKIQNYIINNPANWQTDIENREFCKMFSEKEREILI